MCYSYDSHRYIYIYVHPAYKQPKERMQLSQLEVGRLNLPKISCEKNKWVLCEPNTPQMLCRVDHMCVKRHMLKGKANYEHRGLDFMVLSEVTLRQPKKTSHLKPIPAMQLYSFLLSPSSVFYSLLLPCGSDSNFPFTVKSLGTLNLQKPVSHYLLSHPKWTRHDATTSSLQATLHLLTDPRQCSEHAKD